MPWDLMLAEYNSGLEVIAVILTLVIFVSSLDDLFIDLWYWIRRLVRRGLDDRPFGLRGITCSAVPLALKNRLCRSSSH